jgi:hypothetical protein
MFRPPKNPAVIGINTELTSELIPVKMNTVHILATSFSKSYFNISVGVKLGL